MTTTLAAALGVVFVGMLSTDVLCPDHRALVQSLAMLSLLGAVCAIVGLVRGWASAPFFVVAVALMGVGIGFIDAAHDPTRGRVIALAFGVVTLGAVWLSMRSMRMTKWTRMSVLQPTGDVERAPSPEPLIDVTTEPERIDNR